MLRTSGTSIQQNIISSGNSPQEEIKIAAASNGSVPQKEEIKHQNTDGLTTSKTSPTVHEESQKEIEKNGGGNSKKSNEFPSSNHSNAQSAVDDLESNNEDIQSIQSSGALSMQSGLSASGVLGLPGGVVGGLNSQSTLNDIEK